MADGFHLFSSMPLSSYIVFSLLVVLLQAGAIPPRSTGATDLISLNSSCDGRLHIATPFSRPCYSKLDGRSVMVQDAQCKDIEDNYTSAQYRADQYNGFMHDYGDTCPSSESDVYAKCLLNPGSPANTPGLANASCGQGVLSPHYIEVLTAKDVKAAFEYARQTKQSISIKNSGHDYLSRSSLKGSLALWTRKLQKMQYSANFVPDGCGSDQSFAAMTIGAGISFGQAYAYAEQHNVTFVGGSSPTVGAAGGWSMTGGHGLLSAQYGLGIDRVLEYKIVTADGELRMANACENQDLFWALRGGGGGTFGVVLEMTAKVEPRLELALAVILLPANATDTMRTEFTLQLVENAIRLSHEGWGGPNSPGSIAMVNPFLSISAAEESMAPFASYARSVGGTVTIETFPSFFSVYSQFVAPTANPDTASASFATNRIVPKTLLETAEGRARIQAELSTLQSAGFVPTIFQTTPAYYQSKGLYSEGSTSATPAWRNSVWMITASANWAWNATVAEKRTTVRALKNTTRSLYDLADADHGGGSYMSEADPWTEGWQESWWGPNYARLQTLKAKYDPFGLLTCWRCVGWDEGDARFDCMSGLDEDETTVHR